MVSETIYETIKPWEIYRNIEVPMLVSQSSVFKTQRTLRVPWDTSGVLVLDALARELTHTAQKRELRPPYRAARLHRRFDIRVVEEAFKGLATLPLEEHDHPTRFSLYGEDIAPATPVLLPHVSTFGREDGEERW